MKRDPIEIVECEDGEEPAELCLEYDGVWMSFAERDKMLAEQEARRNRFWKRLGAIAFSIFVIWGLWGMANEERPSRNVTGRPRIIDGEVPQRPADPPQAAIEFLLRNPGPDIIRMFDAKYGPGAAKRVIDASPRPQTEHPNYIAPTVDNPVPTSTIDYSWPVNSRDERARRMWNEKAGTWDSDLTGPVRSGH